MSAQVHLRYRFGVYFFVGGVALNPIDTRWQRVSGLSTTVSLTNHQEGGQNLYTHRLPERISYGNLVLERGLTVGSPLVVEFQAALSLFAFVPSTVIVTLYGDESVPVAGWMFLRAFPTKWTTSDLDADSNEIVIDTMELSYARMQAVRV